MIEPMQPKGKPMLDQAHMSMIKIELIKSTDIRDPNNVFPFLNQCTVVKQDPLPLVTPP